MAEPSLHIGIDGRELLGTPRGVGRFLSEILSRWLAEPRHPHRFSIFVPAEPSPALRSLSGPVQWQVEPATAAGTWWEQTALPRAAVAAGIDVLLAPAYTAPIRIRVPVVQAIHDLSYFAHPEWFSPREGLRRRWITKLSAGRAAAIVTISEFSAGEIVRRLGVSRDIVHVVPLGGPEGLAASSAPREPIVLYVGTMFNRRRIHKLLDAFTTLAYTLPASRLELIGDNQLRPPLNPVQWSIDSGLSGRVSWRAWVDDGELRAAYDRASAFAFLSDYEGFALTPLEAIAHGVPPVLLDTPVAREIYRDAALFVPPDVTAIAGALVSLLTDADLRRRLLERGRALLPAYSWDRTAAEILRILEQAARL